MKRSPLPRRTPLGRSLLRKSRTPETPQQIHRAELEAQREVFRREQLAKFPICQLQVTSLCRKWKNPSTDLHEIVLRSRGGSIVDPTNILCVCRWCHVLLQTHPLFAECIGAMLPSWTYLSEHWEAARLLAESCRTAWLREGWEMAFQLFWTQATDDQVRASIETARREAERVE